MDSVAEWIPAIVLVLGALSPLFLLRWLPQAAGCVLGPKAKLAVMALGIGVVCFVLLSFYNEHQSICTPVRNDGINCDVSKTALVAVMLWVVLIALSQIRFVVTAVRSVTSSQKV